MVVYLPTQQNTTKHPKVHRLVAEAFCAKPADSLATVVNHIDGNKLNNNAENLEWVTLRQNIEHATANGLFRSGERHGMAILTGIQVTNIRHMKGSVSQAWIASAYGVSQMSISNIMTGKSWTRPFQIEPGAAA